VLEPVDDEGCPLLVGLDDDAEAVPAVELRVLGHGLDEVEREVEAVGLLGVDVEADVVAGRLDRQRLEPGQQLVHDAGLLRQLVARVQGRELDRDAGALDRAAPAGSLADPRDRGFVGAEIACGVLGRAGGLAEHVVGVAVALGFQRLGPVQRRLDGPAHDELAPQDLHRLAHGFADHGLAEPSHEAPDERARRAAAGVAAEADDPTGQHQREGRGVDEERARVAEMLVPVGGGDLVADQPFLGVVVGDAEEGLGDAHQHHAFLGRETVLLEEGVDAARAVALAADGRDELAGGRLDALHRPGVELERGEQGAHAGGLVGAVVGVDGGAQRRWLGRRLARWTRINHAHTF
jgi:hypothetical protein